MPAVVFSIANFYRKPISASRYVGCLLVARPVEASACLSSYRTRFGAIFIHPFPYFHSQFPFFPASRFAADDNVNRDRVPAKRSYSSSRHIHGNAIDQFRNLIKYQKLVDRFGGLFEDELSSTYYPQSVPLVTRCCSNASVGSFCCAAKNHVERQIRQRTLCWATDRCQRERKKQIYGEAENKQVAELAGIDNI